MRGEVIIMLLVLLRIQPDPWLVRITLALHARSPGFNSRVCTKERSMADFNWGPFTLVWKSKVL